MSKKAGALVRIGSGSEERLHQYPENQVLNSFTRTLLIRILSSVGIRRFTERRLLNHRSRSRIALRDPSELIGHLVAGAKDGFALAPLDSDDAQHLVRLADAAMYAGKENGKHCIRRNPGELALSS
mgnify:CR=1 FL=1